MLVLFPLTFLSNAFVPADTLPTWLQAFVNINPVSHLVTAVRELTSGRRCGVRPVDRRCSAPRSVVAIFAPLTVRAYMRKA